MITIEELETQLNTKINQINAQLEIFRDNVDRIKVVIGKDAGYVYDKIRTKFLQVVDVYNTTTRRNIEILSSYLEKLNKIGDVTEEVMIQIQALDRDPNDQLTNASSMNSALERVDDAIDSVVPEVQDIVKDITGQEASLSIIKSSICGLGTYLLLNKVLGLNSTISLAVAVMSGYYLGKNKE